MILPFKVVVTALSPLRSSPVLSSRAAPWSPNPGRLDSFGDAMSNLRARFHSFRRVLASGCCLGCQADIPLRYHDVVSRPFGAGAFRTLLSRHTDLLGV